MQSIQLKACRGAWPFPPFTIHEASRYPTLPLCTSPTESLFSESMSGGKRGWLNNMHKEGDIKITDTYLCCACVYMMIMRARKMNVSTANGKNIKKRFPDAATNFQLGPKSWMSHAQKPFAYHWNPQSMPCSIMAVEIRRNAIKLIKNYEESLNRICTG